MAIERNKDGSITIRSNGTITAITGIKSSYTERNKEKFASWVEHCAKEVKACAHTIKETEQYFLTLCDARPLIGNDERLKNFQTSLIMNFFQDQLKHQPSQFSFDMTDEEIEHWHKENVAMREEVKETSPGKLGLVVRGYYLPRTERNAVFYEQAQKSLEELWSHHPKRTDLSQIPPPVLQEQEDLCFFLEETTEHIQVSGGGKELQQKLILFKGVTHEDIEKRTPRFLVYISTLRESEGLAFKS